MTLSRATGDVGHRVFSELPFLLRRGDLLVVNDTKVIHGRLHATRGTGGAVEVFLLSPLPEAGAVGEERWEALARPSKRLKEGEEFEVGDALRVAVDDVAAAERALAPILPSAADWTTGVRARYGAPR